MDHEPEMILQQMEETRTALTEKLETLEQQVVGHVQGASTAVTDTVENVKEAVQQTMDTVKGSVQETVDTVKDTFDLGRQVDRHPWLMLGGSVAVGYLGGRLLGGSSPAPADPGRYESVAPQRVAWPTPPANVGLSNGGLRDYPTAPAPAERTPSSSSSPSLLSTLGETYGTEISKLKGLAIGTVLGLLRDLITRSLPEQMRPEVTDVVNRFTEKMGGQPLAEPLLEQCETDTGRYSVETGRPLGAVHGQGSATLGRPDRR